MKLYVDTNIFLDYLFERKNLQGKDISAPAQKLFYRAISCEFFIVMSDHTATEINKKIELEKARMILEFLKKKIITAVTTKEDVLEAQKLSTTNYADALHVVLAKKSNSDYIITRNLKDFSEFSRIIESKAPEDI
ncbi:MAG: PIN domain-containing protein [archaeon]|jgi:predicted nucleic acid-binding protein